MPDEHSLPDYSAVILQVGVHEQGEVIPAGTRGVIVETFPGHYLVEVGEPWQTVIDVAFGDVAPVAAILLKLADEMEPGVNTCAGASSHSTGGSATRLR